jgi:ABC-type transport system substrate-binding protein
MQPMTSVPPHDAAVAMSAADVASCDPGATSHLQNGTIVRRLQQAYDAMFLFLHTYWERTGRHADEKLGPLLPDCRSHRGRTSVKDADFPSVSTFLGQLFLCSRFVPAAPGQTTNMGGFCDPAIDRKLRRAEAVEAQNPPAATALWQKLEGAILAQAPIVPTVNRQNIDFVSERVRNYQFHPQWGALLDQLWVK